MALQSLFLSVLLVFFAWKAPHWPSYNIQNMLGITNRKLFKAAIEGKCERIAELIARGADVNTKDHYDWTPMHITAHCGHEGAIYVLAKEGADVNAKDCYGSTPIDVAKSQEIRDILKKIYEDRQKAASEFRTQISQS